MLPFDLGYEFAIGFVEAGSAGSYQVNDGAWNVTDSFRDDLATVKLQKVVTDAGGASRTQDVNLVPCNRNPESMILSPTFLCVSPDALAASNATGLNIYGSAFSPRSAHLQLSVEGC